MISKGAQYSKVFRKAGIAWGKGDLPKAIAVLHAGIMLATEQGDAEVARLMREDIERYRHLAQSGKIDCA